MEKLTNEHPVLSGDWRQGGDWRSFTWCNFENNTDDQYSDLITKEDLGDPFPYDTKILLSAPNTTQSADSRVSEMTYIQRTVTLIS